ncbi:MAG: hypothetical protein ACRC8K_07675, partial [Waterburya sp.]
MILHKYLAALSTLTLAISFTTKAIATPANVIVKNDRKTIELINHAKKLYQTEQYLKASQVWQLTAKSFEQQKDILNQAMALSNLALTQQKSGDLTAAESAIATSLKLIQAQSPTTTQQRIFANSLDIQGTIARSQGQSKIAWETWQQAEKIYQQLELSEAVIKNQINQAQALQDLGYYRRASKILTSVQTNLNNQPDSLAKIAVLLSFGNTLEATGNLEQSLLVLQEAAKIAEQLNANKSKHSVLLSLGNTIEALGNRVSQSPNLKQANLTTPKCLADNNLENPTAYYLQAENCYQQAALSKDLETKNKAQLNLLSLIIQGADIGSIEQQSPSSLLKLIANIKTNLNRLPVTRTTIYDRLNLVQSLICLQPNALKYSSPIVQQCPVISGLFQQLTVMADGETERRGDGENFYLKLSDELDVNKNMAISWSEIVAEIEIARQQSKQLQDQQALAYANGYLGAVYQQTGRLTLAQQLTQQALLTTDSIISPESAYLWQWQLGRIYQLK